MVGLWRWTTQSNKWWNQIIWKALVCKHRKMEAYHSDFAVSVPIIQIFYNICNNLVFTHFEILRLVVSCLSLKRYSIQYMTTILTAFWVQNFKPLLCNLHRSKVHVSHCSNFQPMSTYHEINSYYFVPPHNSSPRDKGKSCFTAFCEPYLLYKIARFYIIRKTVCYHHIYGNIVQPIISFSYIVYRNLVFDIHMLERSVHTRLHIPKIPLVCLP